MLSCVHYCVWISLSRHHRTASCASAVYLGAPFPCRGPGDGRRLHFTGSRPLAPPQPHRLAVLLQLGNELVALAHDVLVLLVLVVGPVRLDDALARHAVDGTGDAAAGDELG